MPFAELVKSTPSQLNGHSTFKFKNHLGKKLHSLAQWKVRDREVPVERSRFRIPSPHLDECYRDFALSMTRLTCNRLQRLMVVRKKIKMC